MIAVQAPEPRHENQHRLAGFVESARRQALAMPAEAAAKTLQANAEILRRHLRALDRRGRTPSHLEGLSAFDLANAADALEAAAAARS